MPFRQALAAQKPLFLGVCVFSAPRVAQTAPSAVWVATCTFPRAAVAPPVLRSPSCCSGRIGFLSFPPAHDSLLWDPA